MGEQTVFPKSALFIMFIFIDYFKIVLKARKVFCRSSCETKSLGAD